MKFKKLKFDREKSGEEALDEEKDEKKEAGEENMEKDKNTADDKDSQEERAYEKEDESGMDDEKRDGADFNAERMEFEAQKELMRQKLPLEFAGMLAGESEEETAENVALFKRFFLKAVESALSKRLKGSEPKTGGIGADEAEDPFLRGFGF